MTLDKLFNNAKCNTQDAGYEEGHVSHRKDGDYIKQGGSWVPMKGQKQEAGKEEAGADEQTMRQSLINFMTKGLPHVPEADAKKAIEGLPADTLNEMFNNLKEQHGDKYLAQQEAAPEKSKDDAYMDEHGLHDIYMDIKNNELEDYTVEEIAKEYRITKGDAEVIKNRIENNKRAKEQDKQDRKGQAAAGSTEAAITPELREKAKAEKQEAARKESVIREWLDETGLQKKAGAGSTEGWASKAFTTSQKKQMEKLGFKANGDSWVTERNGHKYEIKVNQQNNPYMSEPTTSAELYIDGDKRPYQFGGGETIDPNSMVKLEKALKEQGYNNLSTGMSAPKDAAPKLTGDCKVKLSKIKK